MTPEPTFAMQLPDDWAKRAACRELPPSAKELFFPDYHGPENSREAKAICAGCDVRRECLDWAMKTNEQYGVWGGLSAPERRRLRRKTADVRFKACRQCKGLFSFVWEERPSYKAPNYCGDVCRTAARREGKRLSRLRRSLGNAVNGVVE